MGTASFAQPQTGGIMENGVDPNLTLDEIKEAYRRIKGSFLLLHRIMIRHGLVSEQERIVIYDLTKKVN